MRGIPWLETAPVTGRSGINRKINKKGCSLITKTQWQYLERRPQSWRQQLDIKGRKLRAHTVLSDMIVNEMTPAEVAESKELPLTAVYFNRSNKKRRTSMASNVKVWYDKEGDYLEVFFSDKPGYMRETNNDAVMEMVDEEGNILGFSILAVIRLSQSKPLVAELVGKGELE